MCSTAIITSLRMMLIDDLFQVPRVVPFLCSTKQRFQFNIPIQAPSDPTRRMKTDCDYFLPQEMIVMHHWSWIRDDIRKKIMSWSAGDMFPLMGTGSLKKW